MQIKVKFPWLYMLCAFIFFVRYYFYQIDTCFSDICRHSQSLAVLDGSFRVENLVFFAHQSNPIFLYFSDLPFIFFILLSERTSISVKFVLGVWSVQPSYDLIFLVSVLTFMTYAKLKMMGFLMALVVKFETLFLVLSMRLAYWDLFRRFNIIPNIPVILTGCFLVLLVGSIFNLSVIDGPINGKFNGNENTLVRFGGYMLMPLSSVISLDFNVGLGANLVRIQCILLSWIFALKLRNKLFLSNYIVVCTIISLIINFYQLRYALILVSVYSFYVNANRVRNKFV